MESTSAMKGYTDLNWASVGHGCFFCWSSSKELYILRQQPKVLYNKVVWSLLGYIRTLMAFFGEVSGSIRLFIILYIKISIDNYEDSIHPPAQGRWFSLIGLIKYLEAKGVPLVKSYT